MNSYRTINPRTLLVVLLRTLLGVQQYVLCLILPYPSFICACMQTQTWLMSYIVFAPSQLCGLHWLCW